MYVDVSAWVTTGILSFVWLQNGHGHCLLCPGTHFTRKFQRRVTDKIACKGLMPPSFQIDVDRRPVTICPHFSPHPPLQLGMQLPTVLRDRHNTDEQVPPPSNDVDGDSASKLDKTMLRDLDFRSKGPAVYRLSFELRTFVLPALVRKMVVAINQMCDW